jgi:hypothetical protein
MRKYRELGLVGSIRGRYRTAADCDIFHITIGIGQRQVVLESIRLG